MYIFSCKGQPLKHVRDIYRQNLYKDIANRHKLNQLISYRSNKPRYYYCVGPAMWVGLHHSSAIERLRQVHAARNGNGGHIHPTTFTAHQIDSARLHIAVLICNAAARPQPVVNPVRE